MGILQKYAACCGQRSPLISVVPNGDKRPVHAMDAAHAPFPHTCPNTVLRAHSTVSSTPAPAAPTALGQRGWAWGWCRAGAQRLPASSLVWVGRWKAGVYWGEQGRGWLGARTPGFPPSSSALLAAKSGECHFSPLCLSQSLGCPVSALGQCLPSGGGSLEEGPYSTQTPWFPSPGSGLHCLLLSFLAERRGEQSSLCHSGLWDSAWGWAAPLSCREIHCKAQAGRFCWEAAQNHLSFAFIGRFEQLGKYATTHVLFNNTSGTEGPALAAAVGAPTRDCLHSALYVHSGRRCQIW